MPRSKKLSDAMKEERREKILKGALRLFATRGLAGTKISDIAMETGMAQGLVYHYYRSKDDIYTDLISTAFEKLTYACRELEKLPLSPAEKIQRALEGLIKSFWHNNHTAFNYLLIAQATATDTLPEKLKKSIHRQNKLPYSVIEDIIKKGQKDDMVWEGDPQQLAILFWSIIKGLAIHRSSHKDTTIEPDIHAIKRMFLKRI